MYVVWIHVCSNCDPRRNMKGGTTLGQGKTVTEKCIRNNFSQFFSQILVGSKVETYAEASLGSLD